jgi:predicted permease
VGLLHDLRHAVRLARRHPGFSAVVIATTALGIGLNSAVFSLFDALLLRPPPVAAPERLVHVYSSVPGDFLSHTPMAFPDYEAVRDEARSLVAVAAYAWYPLALERGTASELVIAEAVTGNYFTTLGVGPALGRVLTGLDDRPGAAEAAVVLSHDVWRRHFAGAPDVAGREILLNGRAFTVVGVAPREFRGLVAGFAPDLWLPLHAAVALPTGVTIALGDVTPGLPRTADRAQRWVWVTGRLRPGAAADRAGAELAVLASRLRRDFPETNTGRELSAVAAGDVRLLPGVDRAVWTGSLLVVGVFALGLLLAAVNVASLFLARALGRRREIATRLAIGAGRRRLVGQLFCEGLVLALAGGGLGLLLAHLCNALLGRIELPFASSVNWPLKLVLAPALDARVLGFALIAAVLTAVVFALLPALEATRADLAETLRELGGGAVAGRSRGLRSALVAVQVAVAVVLLAAAGVAVRSLAQATRVDPGFDAARAAAVTLSPDLLGYGAEESEELFTRLQERVAALPGVESAAFASHLPLTAAINFGEVAAAGGDGPETPVDFAGVGPGYFATMRIPLAAGRAFDERDGPGGRRVVIVNETLAERLWPGAPAVGRRLRDGAEVVGVARDGKYRTLWEAARPFLYSSLGQDRRGTRTLVVRTAGDPRPLLPALHGAIRELDPRVPVSGARTLAETIDGALALPRAAAALLALFGAIALLLASAGIFGVVAYLASAQWREIGLRLALGASRGVVLRWLLRRGLAPVATGLAGGVATAASAAWVLSARFAGVRPLELPALLAAIALLALAALAAALGPAWVAARRDPSSALRHE